MSKNVFDKRVKIGEYLILEAYDNAVSIWDCSTKEEVFISITQVEEFLREFKQMCVDVKAVQAGKVGKGFDNEELESEIMLDQLSIL
jgi:mannose/fructose/N-acetylgalactosamine-specific phosphotransferase system component IIB